MDVIGKDAILTLAGRRACDAVSLLIEEMEAMLMTREESRGRDWNGRIIPAMH